MNAGALAVQKRACNNCHTGEHGLLAGSEAAPNLTPDTESGIGGWDDSQIIDALRYGTDNVGVTLCSTMPRDPKLSDQEAKAIVAYLRTLKPVFNSGGFDATCTPTAKDRALHGQLVAQRHDCAGCHGSDLAGADGPNLTPDMDTGVGGWSDDQLRGAIVNGVDDQGATLCQRMPRFMELTDDELGGLVTYLRSIPAVSHDVEATVCDPNDPAQKGLTFVNQRACASCHGADLSGNDTGLMNGTIFPPNITPDKDTGIGSWSKELIVRALRTGLDDQGEPLCSVIQRYTDMSNEEANDIAAYLLSLQPVSHSVPDSQCGDPSMPPPPPPPTGCDMPAVVLSEVYGGGGNTGAVFNADFVELHNRSGAAVDVSGWSIQYASAAGSSWAVAAIPPGTSIEAGGFKVLQVGAVGTHGAALPSGAVMLSRTLDMSASSGKVAVVSSATALSGSCPTAYVDLLGYGTANCHEGGAAAPQLSAQLAAVRGAGGCTETQANAADFSAAAPAMHSAPAMCTCQ